MPCKLHILFCASLALALRSCPVGAAKTSPPLLPKKHTHTHTQGPSETTISSSSLNKKSFYFKLARVVPMHVASGPGRSARRACAIEGESRRGDVACAQSFGPGPGRGRRPATGEPPERSVKASAARPGRERRTDGGREPEVRPAKPTHMRRGAAPPRRALGLCGRRVAVRKPGRSMRIRGSEEKARCR